MFKYKPDKLKNQEKICTLDGIHRERIKTFEQARSSLYDKKLDLQASTERLRHLNSIDQATLTDADIRLKAHLKSEISRLTNEINDISNNTSELDYYSKIDNIIFSYYGIIDEYNKPNTIRRQTNYINVNTDQAVNSHKRVKNLQPQRDIMSFFMELDNSVDATQQNLPHPKNRAYLHEQYVNIINNGKNKKRKNINNTTKYCQTCKCERTLIQSEGIYVCEKCGETETTLIESDVPNYKEMALEKPIYPYKRLNHLVEWLNQFQAKESTDIPKEVYDAILLELKRSRIYNLQDLSISEMKAVLKKLKFHQYYEHIPHIISKISGKHPPTLSREIEEEIKQMFKEIQEPFAKYCPDERTNFLSYSYVLHKFFQILKMDEFVVYFPLLKSREKLRLQDKLWKKICEDLKQKDSRWEFYPSI